MTLFRILIASISMVVFATAAAEAAPTVYIPLGHANAVAVVDAAQDRVTHRIEGVKNAHGLAATPDGKTLVAGSLMPRAQGEAPERPANVSEDDHRAHHASEAQQAGGHGGPKGTLYIIDSAQRAIRQVVDVPGIVHHNAITVDGQHAISTHPQAAGISVVDIADGSLVTFVNTGPAPNYASSSPGGDQLYVSNAGNDTVSIVDTRRWIVQRNVVVGDKPEHMVLSPDGKRLYVANVGDGTISVVDTVAAEEVKSWPVGASPHGLDLSHDGATLYVSSKTEDKLIAVDTATGKRRERSLAPAPYHIAVIRGAGKLYVSSRSAPRVWVVDAGTLESTEEFSLTGGVAHQMAVVE